ncbi:MAG: GNAT family N-acetyltransferase [Pseudomonadota bacterium]
MSLAPILAADCAELLKLWRDPAVRQYLWDDELIDGDTVRQVQAASDTCFHRLGSGLYALRWRSDPGRLIGFCGFRAFDGQYPAELLYGIYPDYWGMGIVTEAAKEVLHYGFERCAFERVIAATDTPNQNSVRVMQRLGLQFVERKLWHGLDTVFYALERHEYLRQ